MKLKKVPQIEEKDIEEKFVRSSGPGGQNVNKRETCVQLRHIPTGVSIKCMEERTQERNREIARNLLRIKVDEFYNGENSVSARQHAFEREKLRIRREKLNKLRDKKLKFETLKKQQEEEDR